MIRSSSPNNFLKPQELRGFTCLRLSFIHYKPLHLNVNVVNMQNYVVFIKKDQMKVDVFGVVLFIQKLQKVVVILIGLIVMILYQGKKK